MTYSQHLRFSFLTNLAAELRVEAARASGQFEKMYLNSAASSVEAAAACVKERK
jgi:hypothetical protein